MRRQSVPEIVDAVLARCAGARVALLAPLVRGKKGEYRKELEAVHRQGYLRARVDGAWVELDDPPKLARYKRHDIDVVVDRLAVEPGAADAARRLARERAQARAAGWWRWRASRARGRARTCSSARAPPARTAAPACAELAAAQLLVQLALRGVPDLRGAREPAQGGPGAGGPGPGAVHRGRRGGGLGRRGGHLGGGHAAGAGEEVRLLPARRRGGSCPRPCSGWCCTARARRRCGSSTA